MSIDPALLRNLQLLSPEDQKKVAAYVETLAAAKPRRPAKDATGASAHYGIDIPRKTPNEARREARTNVSREVPESG